MFPAGRSALGSIFINYRRNDSEGEAGRLFDELTGRFGEDSVFMDVAAIEPGRDFRKAIDESVAACRVLLAMIGNEWLNSRDSAGQPRLADSSDFVRIELASALQREIAVVPVLVRGARMPAADELPDDLKDLAYRNAVELTHARWKSDVQVLIRALQPWMDRPASTTALPTTATPAPRSTAASQILRPPNDLSGIEPHVIHQLRRELAHYIGPIAGVVVKRTAQQCVTVSELISKLALEIREDTDRARFLRAVRSR